MCISSSTSQKSGLVSLSPTSGCDHSVSLICFSILQAKSVASLFFYRLHFLGKQVILTKKPWMAIASCPWRSYHPPARLLTRSLSKCSQFPAFAGFSQKITLPHFHPKYQQPSSFWEERKIHHQVNIPRDDRRSRNMFAFIFIFILCYCLKYNK